SRIIVKDLPKHVTEAELRDHFSPKGEITDAKLIRLKEGKSRQFAFIGFRSDHEAQDAVKSLNKSYLGASRIVVEIAHKVGAENVPRPWSRHSLKKEGKVDGESSNGISTKGDKKTKKKPEADDDPELQEFFDVMQRGKSKIWSNDVSIAPTAEVTTEGKVPVKKADKTTMDSDGDEPDKAQGEEELKEHFSKFGETSEVHLVLDKETKRSKGFAYILYPIPECAARAMEELDHSIFQGRLLHIMPAKHRETSTIQVNDTSHLPKTFKQKREEQRKASEAGGNTKSWNSLFMRPDTILENIVRVYGVSKSEFLDREAEDPAVRLALGETKVIAETKEALAKAGVNVTSLEEFATGKGDEKNRSKHIILVKNLPFASTEKELAQMFGKFGRLDKIILPPTKTLALVVFLEPAEARTAMKGMKYKQYKDGPLYLEWAPGEILEAKTLPDSNVEENDVRRVDIEQQVKIDHDVTESNVLHVTNLSFNTTDEGLKKHLTRLVKQGKILSVKIIKHLKNGKNVSSGYGFVEFDSVETATNVCRDLEGTSLDGHALKLRFCEQKRSDTGGKGSDKEKASTKLHVKNVAFEATKKELTQLFSPFGQIKSLRLPKRNIGQFAGFAFVEFMTKQEASNAKKALSSTHFYGRHLVLEWANDDKSMEETRRRSAAKYMEQENDNNAKRRRLAE
ncbi:unnamed protein product, partial [Thlaspi arvense]